MNPNDRTVERPRRAWLATATLLVMISGGLVAGCGGTAVAALDDGDHIAWMTVIDASSRLVEIDPVQVLSGQEAADAAREDGELADDGEVPNDVYVRNPEATIYGLTVAEDASAEIYDCSGGCEIFEVDVNDLLSGAALAYGGTTALFDLTVEDGTIVALSELYLP